MTDIRYKKKRGADLVLILRATLNEFDGTETVSAALKLSSWRKNASGVDEGSVANFVPAFVAASGSTAAYWTLTIPSSVTDDLAPDEYKTDAKFVINGVTDYTPTVYITIEERVTP